MNKRKFLASIASIVALTSGALVAPSLGSVASATAPHVEAVGAGATTSCVVTPSGGVECSGSGTVGELGNGTNTAKVASPVVVKNTAGTGPLTGVQSVSSGGYSSCALLTTGGVDCWGYGNWGDLGNGSNANSNIPVPVEGIGGVGLLSNVVQLSVGDDYDNGYDSVCALLSNGGVDCWGYGMYGTLGDGANLNSNVPVAVMNTSDSSALSNVAGISNGGQVVCALLNSGGVDCWGWGDAGELGTGVSGTVWEDFPQPVVGVGGGGTLAGAVQLSVGASDDWNGSQACVLLNSGGVDCWGYGGWGSLGDGSIANADSPTAVEGVGGMGALSGATSVSVGDGVTCAILRTKTADCWGYGTTGDLGNGISETVTTPVPVSGVGGAGLLGNVIEIDISYWYNCAELLNGNVDCWGNANTYGEFAIGTFAFGSFGGEIDASAYPVQSAYVAFVPELSLPAPTGLLVNETAGSVAASWYALSNANGYECTLLYGFGISSAFSEKVTSDGCTFAGLSPLVVYGVQVAAIDSSGVVSTTNGSAFPYSYSLPSVTTTTVAESMVSCTRGKIVRLFTRPGGVCPLGWIQK